MASEESRSWNICVRCTNFIKCSKSIVLLINNLRNMVPDYFRIKWTTKVLNA